MKTISNKNRCHEKKLIIRKEERRIKGRNKIQI